MSTTVGDVDSKALAAELTRVAMRDFEASKLLFKRKLYPQAIFMLQQSLEKSMKAILLKLNLVSIKELKEKIRHSLIRNALELVVYRSLETFIVLVGNIIWQLNEIRKRVPQDHKVYVEEAYSTVKNIIIDMVGFSSIALSELSKHRRKISTYVKTLRNIAFQKLDSETENKLDKVMDELTSLAIPSILPSDIIEYISKLDSITKKLSLLLTSGKCEEMLKQYEEGLRRATLNLQLAIDFFIMIFWYTFLEPIVSNVRYPSIRSEGEIFSPLNIDENMAIVKWCKDVMERIEKTSMLLCLKEFIEEKVETPKSEEILERLRKYLTVITTS